DSPFARGGVRRPRLSGQTSRGEPCPEPTIGQVSSEELQQRYAELTVRVGANVGEGQDVIIAAYVEQAPFVRALAKAAYEAGARYVNAFYADQLVRRQFLIHASEETLEWSPPWLLAQLDYFGEVEGAWITVAGDPNPDVFADIDGPRVGTGPDR